MYAGDGPFRSPELAAWLVVQGDLLRVSDDAAGTKVWPTTAEERDRAAEERDRAAEERDAARQRAEAAEARIRALEAMLAAQSKG